MPAPETLTLTGAWHLLPVDSFRQGFYPLDEATWIGQDLPAHWQQHPLLERYVGKMVYRRRFALPSSEFSVVRSELPDDSEHATRNTQHATLAARYWLRMNGIFYCAQPFFNGVDLGRSEGYFAPHEHEVTRWVQPENDLLIEVECPDEPRKTGKRLITGIFSHWDSIDPTLNPGGIWAPVELVRTGPVRLTEALLHTEVAGTEAAELRFCAAFDSSGQQDVTLRWTFAPHNFAGQVQTIEQRRALASGTSEVAGVLSLRDPQLWWTHDMGHPNLYRVTLVVLCGGELSDARSFTFGVRSFELHNWIAHLNGMRLFVKGSNYPPADARLATVTPELCRRDMQLAAECHMNLLRVHGHIAPPALYEAADEAGILIWQDFPLQWLYRRSAAPEALRQARQMVRLLYNHPAVVVWCAHNEPIFVTDTKEEGWLPGVRTRASVFVFSWNRDVLDTQLKRAIEAHDPTRAVVRSSGEYAVPFLRPGTSTHFYYGWYPIYGKLREWEAVARHFPDNIRFVTEFGAQSFPNAESCRRFMADDPRNVDWRQLEERHMFQPNVMDHWLDWRSATTLDELARITQAYQSQLHRFYVDRLRHRKYRPTGGVVPFMFHDPNPGVSWSVLDYWRVPKQSYHALRLAFSPQYVFTLLAQDVYPPGAALDLPVYIVNDAHRDVPTSLAARLHDPSGRELAAVARELHLPADCMAMEIERLRLTPERPGTYRLTLNLRPEGGEEIVNVYEIVVV
jgi:beta-mannosidase